MPQRDSRLDQETDRVLPQPGILASRSAVWLSLALLGAAAAWATWAEVDVVVHSRARLVVEGEPMALTPPEEGLVVDVPVSVGSRVAAGDVLLRLRSLEYGAEAAQIASEVDALRSEETRHLEAARAAQAGVAALRAELELVRSQVGIVEEQLAVFDRLRAKGAASAIQIQNKKQELADAQARVLRLESEMRQARETAADRERQASEAGSRAKGQEARIAARKASVTDMTVVAPVAGTIAFLAVKHAGRVASVDEPAVLLEPEGLPLRARLAVPNASMRRLEPGYLVRLRLDAYPLADHGHVEGRLLRIEPAPDAAGSFSAWVSLERATRPDRLDLGRLRPGLDGDADVVIERRRVLDLVLEPFRKLAEHPLTVED